jgi:hypothetical protein
MFWVAISGTILGIVPYCPIFEALGGRKQSMDGVFWEPSMDTIYLMYYVRLFLIVQVVTW